MNPVGVLDLGAAVDEDDLAGDIAGLLATQEACDGGDIFRLLRCDLRGCPEPLLVFQAS